MPAPNGEHLDDYNTPWQHDDPCPENCLCHNITSKKVAEQLSQFNTEGDLGKVWAVYVLECKWIKQRGARDTAIHKLGATSRIPSWVEDASSAKRRLYVGYSKKAAQRIKQHALGQTFNFTTVYPPVRLLSVDWYTSFTKVKYEKAKLADWLDANLESTYVYCRGEQSRYDHDPIY